MRRQRRSPQSLVEVATAALYLGVQLRLLLTEQYFTSAALFVIALFVYLKYELRGPTHRPQRRSRYQQLRANGGRHTEAEWEKLKRRYSYRCAKCGSSDELTKDHVVPVSLGGSDSITNLQPLCQSCNSSKGTKIADYR